MLKRILRKVKPLHRWLASKKQRWLWEKAQRNSAKIPQILPADTKSFANWVWEAYPGETTAGPGFLKNLNTYGYTPEENQWLETIFGETRQLPAPFYAVFENAEVVGEYGMHFHHEGQVIVEACLGQVEYLHRSMDHSYMLHRHRYPVQEGPDAAIVLFNKLSRNFYHFYLETLPRLQFLEKFTAETGIQPHILLPENSPSFMKPLLAFYFNIGEERIATYRPGRMKVKTLILPSYSFLRNHQLLWQTLKHPQWYRFYHQHPALQTLPQVPSADVLVVSRKKATMRRILNEDALVASLAPAKVRVVCLEDLPLVEQMACFRHAKVAILPHGAGLSHMVTSAGCSFIELYPDRRPRVNADFYALAATLNIPHHVICCPSVGEAEDLTLTPDILHIIQHICKPLLQT